ncbi:MAG: hypothetical protein C4548_10730 [Desulfobacteraceae bacterium]|jgi:hypothetical protein|nr:MAG: hypothetical protein C4548_10730 [Desulfobacteraceae bacterium]
MFDYKTVTTKLTKLNPLSRQAQAIPADFGSMYLLYPSENDSAAVFSKSNMFDRVMEKVRLRWQRAKDIRYYRQNSIY